MDAVTGFYSLTRVHQSHQVRAVLTTISYSFALSHVWDNGSAAPQGPLDSSCDGDTGGAECPSG